MTTSETIPALDARPVLENLQHLVDLVEGSNDLEVTTITVDLLTTTTRSMGAGTPALQILALPKDILGGDMIRADAQRVTFVLERSTVSQNFADIDRQLQQSARVISDGLQALAPFQGQFVTTAKMEFKFELTSEGKFNFFIRLGAKALDAHSITLEVKAKAPPTTAQ